MVTGGNIWKSEEAIKHWWRMDILLIRWRSRLALDAHYSVYCTLQGNACMRGMWHGVASWGISRLTLHPAGGLFTLQQWHRHAVSLLFQVHPCKFSCILSFVLQYTNIKITYNFFVLSFIPDLTVLCNAFKMWDAMLWTSGKNCRIAETTGQCRLFSLYAVSLKSNSTFNVPLTS